MDIRIPSLLRIKPDTLFKLGKYLRKHGFDRIALCYGEGIEELVGRSIRISLDSSEYLQIFPSSSKQIRKLGFIANATIGGISSNLL